MSVSDAAIAQAFRKMRQVPRGDHRAVREFVDAVYADARELDAEKGGDAEFVCDICGTCQQVFYTPHTCPQATPPAQAAEAARVELPTPFGWITDEAEYSLVTRGGNGSRGTVPLHAKESKVANLALYSAADLEWYGEQIRAAIAAMQAGEAK